MISTIARPPRMLAFVYAALFATLTVGCSSETGEGSDPSGDPDPLASVAGDEPLDKAGCNYVQYCNASGSLGTVCVQSGCGYCQAVRECERETQIVCGGPTEAWVFKYQGGGGNWDSMWAALDYCD